MFQYPLSKICPRGKNGLISPFYTTGDHARISKYKDIFTKGCTPNWSEEVLLIKKFKNTVPWAYLISNLNGDKIIGTFYEKELQGNKSNRN